MKKAFFLVFALLGTAIALAPQTSAASGFNAGRIIDDSVFTNKSSMSVSDIQSFLNSKVAACDTSGSQQSEMNNSGVPDYNGNGSIQRWEWGKYKFNQTTFPCLKDYTQDSVSAAQLIYNASQNYSINPQVLIVLLQKEQGLVTDTWPLNIQYRSATGYGCPDTAACDSQYYGLANQITWASKMFRAILNNSPDWYTPYVLGNNYIQYSPDSNCGGSTVNIQNRSTQALYNYTPYQPNQATLDAGWGTAPCGAYGNRNFYLYFTSWFGDPLAVFTSLDTPRWMQISTATHKVNPSTGQAIDNEIPSGTQLQFVDKIYLNNTWYLRTASDSANNLLKGIPQQYVTDIQFQPFSEPRYMVLTKNAKKVNPRNTNSISDEVFSITTSIKFVSKMVVNGQWFYQTEYDNQNNNISAFYANSTSDISFQPLDTPRFMQVKKDTRLTDLRSGNIISTYQDDGQAMIIDKVELNGIWYFRSKTDSQNGNIYAISANNTSELKYDDIATPYSVAITNNSTKYSLLSGDPLSTEPLATNQIIKIARIVTLNGRDYYQSIHDRDNNISNGIAVNETKLHDTPFIPLENSRAITLNTSTQKTNLMSGALTGEQLATGTTLRFASKIQIGRQWYLRSISDTDNSLPYGIPIEKLNI